MDNEEKQALEAQKRRHIADLLAQYEAGQHENKKTALIKAGLALIFDSIHIANVPATNYNGGGPSGDHR